MKANTPTASGSAEVSRRPPPDETLLSIVLPVYNEAAVLPILSARIARALANCSGQYEVVFVDDGSTDAGGWILDLLCDSNPRIRVVHLSRNFGHQAAVQAGLAHARGDAIVLMDSDMQDSPEAIPRMVERWWAGFDVVYAVRTRRKESLLKRLLFAAFHRGLAHVASIPIPAEAGVFGLIDRRVADEILAMAEADRYFPGLRCWVGFRQTGIEVERNARYDVRPRVSWAGLFRLAKTAVFSFSALPLRAFYVIGASAAVLFLLLSAFALVCKLGTGMAIPGWTSQLLVASFFGALNALGICMLGEYVVRIYDQVRGRPLYVVRGVYCAPDEAGPPPSSAGAPQRAGDQAAPAVVPSAPTDWPGSADRRSRRCCPLGSEAVGKPGALAPLASPAERLSGPGPSVPSAPSTDQLWDEVQAGAGAL